MSTDCLSIIQRECPAMCADVMARLSDALKPLVHDFRVHDSASLITIYISEGGFHSLRLSATISLDLCNYAWREEFKPSTSPHMCDHAAVAGRYVLSGVRVSSTVQVPALNEATANVVVATQKLLTFANVIHAAEVYLVSLLEEKQVEFGDMYLLGGGLPDPEK